MTSREKAAYTVILDGMLATLDTPQHWCKGYHALDSLGLEVEPHEPEAVRFCIFGAALRTIKQEQATHTLIDDGFSLVAINHWLDKRCNEYTDGRFNVVTGLNDHPITPFETVVEFIRFCKQRLESASLRRWR